MVVGKEEQSRSRHFDIFDDDCVKETKCRARCVRRRAAIFEISNDRCNIDTFRQHDCEAL